MTPSWDRPDSVVECNQGHVYDALDSLRDIGDDGYCPECCTAQARAVVDHIEVTGLLSAPGTHQLIVGHDVPCRGDWHGGTVAAEATRQLHRRGARVSETRDGFAVHVGPRSKR